MEQEQKIQLKKLLLSRNWKVREEPVETDIEVGSAAETSNTDPINQFGSLDLTWDLPGSLDLHPLLWRVWKARNYTAAEILELIYPVEIVYPEPFVLTDMRLAVELIYKALARDSRILIFGDYDTDGLTATALLSRWFRAQGVTTINLIPDRLRDGYGLTMDQVKQILTYEPDLVITVDCGSSSLEEVKLLEDRGIPVIVTDHHTWTGIPHTASAFINPQREGDSFPLAGLAGVGVAYYLLLALEHPSEPNPMYRILAAIGTVADVMPVRGVNRRLIVDAICDYHDYAPIGIKKLAECCRKPDEELSTSLIQFSLAPRLNAAGRLGEAETVLELLLTDDEEEAKYLAERLNILNSRRRELEKEQIEQARLQVEAGVVLGRDRIVIVAHESFHPGILGILSARLVDYYQVPVICLALEDGVYRGSARTYGNLDIYSAIESCSDLLLSYGGHEGAAGLSLAIDKLEAFTERINEYIINLGDFSPAELTIDLELSGLDLTLEAARALEILEPIGEQNQKPIFLLRAAEIVEIYRIGDGSHLRMVLNTRGLGRITAIAFRQGVATMLYKPGDRIDIAFYLIANVWRGNENVNLQIEEIRLSAEENRRKEKPAISRLMIAYVFKKLSLLLETEQELMFVPRHLAHWLSNNYNELISVDELFLILKLFSDSGLGSLRSSENGNWVFCFNTIEERIDLKTTRLWHELYSQGSIIDASRTQSN